MEKLIRINHCGQCPHSKEDDNKTRLVCRKAWRDLYFFYSKEEDNHTIPEWCPLPDHPEPASPVGSATEDAKIEPVSHLGFEIDVKRLNVPFILTGKCPECGEEVWYDFSKNEYLSYPVLGKPYKQHMYCEECGHEWEVSMCLTIGMELVQVGKKEKNEKMTRAT